ncbi:DUF72 domain-containing protein [Thermatribacter velox]|jgi:uncharacterized protein YecE (DUF72 family)|uniref:DUF72 domain-containing protein n=1 Tax=Thermatribacter velox TaxID=3039681 RepID=A0ABZ2YDC0_9BACT
MIYTGVCGFPKKRELIFQNLDGVEIQETFYHLVNEAKIARLKSEAPPGFTFTMKANQIITHSSTSPTYRRSKLPEDFRKENLGFFKPTEEVEFAYRHSLLLAKVLEAKALIFQCPPSFKPSGENLKNLQSFFESANQERPQELLFGLELRGGWPEELIQKICQDFDLVHVVDPFQERPTAGKVYYFRLHGKGKYHYRYSETELQELVQRIKRLPEKECFLFFNNTFMYENALEMKALLLKGSERST